MVVVLQAGRRNDVSDSYAKALVELAEEKAVLEQVHADVDAVAGLVKENKKLAGTSCADAAALGSQLPVD